MLYGQVPGLNKPVSRLIQGTTVLTSEDVAGSYRLLDGLFEMGCTTFDSAHIYGGGDCERILGGWMAERGIRDRVVVVTKGAHFNADRNRVTPFDITSDLHDSLARLQTDYIDLYLLHRDDLAVDVAPIVEVLNELCAAGKLPIADTEQARLTFHDPCQLVRQGGVVQEPRTLLKLVASNFVEMNEAGTMNWCCGGGGGVSAIEGAERLRLKAFMRKKAQLDELGVQMLVTACANCRIVIEEGLDAYQMELPMVGLTELIAEHLREEREPKP